MSTVGYGGDAGGEGFGEPSMPGTKYFCIAYSAVGIFGIVERLNSLLDSIQVSTEAKLNAMAELQAELQAARKMKMVSTRASYGTHDMPDNEQEQVPEPSPAWQFYTFNITIFAGGFIVWLLFNTWIFCTLEPGLSFTDSIYFSWITVNHLALAPLTTRARSCSPVHCSLPPAFPDPSSHRHE